jgi:serine/threonine protein kinase
MTAPGTVIGTPDYMAPEQFAGDPVDPRADIYALGVMFYRMVTGSLPHQGESARETLTKRLTEPPRPLAEAAPDSMFPEGLQAVVTRVLARKPGDRYPTAGAFGTALVELFTGPLEIATMPTVRLDTATAPVPKPAPQRRGVALAVGGVIAAAAITAILLLRPSASNGASPLGNNPVQPPPPPSTVSPQPAAVGPPPAAPGRDTSRTASSGTRPGGGLKPVNPAPESLRVAPPPPSGVPSTPLPTINDLNVLNVVDSSSRDADRAKAVQYYNRTEADPVVRARAAFMVAIGYSLDREYRLAEAWATRAIATNEATAPGPERADRDMRYRNWRMTNRQKITSDSTGP